VDYTLPILLHTYYHAYYHAYYIIETNIKKQEFLFDSVNLLKKVISFKIYLSPFKI